MAEFNGKLMGVLSAFIVAVVGIALLVGTADASTSVTQSYTVTNESTTLTNNTPVNLANTQLSAVTRVGNNSITVGTNFYSVDLDSGVLTPAWGSNTTLKNGVYHVSYTYHEVGSSSARVFVGLVVLLFAIAVVMNVYGGIGPNLKDMFGL